MLLTATACTCGLCTRLACLAGPCLLLDLQAPQSQHSGTHATSLVLQVRHPLEQCIVMPSSLHACHNIQLCNAAKVTAELSPPHLRAGNPLAQFITSR